MDEIGIPYVIEYAKLDFVDVNTALATAISNFAEYLIKKLVNYTKTYLSKMIEEAVNKEPVIIRKEMSLLKEDIVEETKNIWIRFKQSQIKIQEYKLHSSINKCASP